MEDYRKLLYSKYHSAHGVNTAGSGTQDAVRAQFGVWERYFGRFLPQDSGARILDLGCGNGGFVYWLRSKGFSGAIGVDASEEQVAQAEKNSFPGIERGDAVEFLSSRIERFDLIFARDLVEHFRKDELPALFEAMRCALAPEGVLILQTPNGESPFAGRMRYSDLTHENIFTWESLSQLFAITGFCAPSFYPVTPPARGPVSATRALLWKFIEAGLRFCTLVETGSAIGYFTRNIIARARKYEERENGT